MADPYVREIGRAGDMGGGELAVGVDYDAVTIGRFGGHGTTCRLGSAQAEEFAQLFVSAVWQAGQQAGQMAAEVRGGD